MPILPPSSDLNVATIDSSLKRTNQFVKSSTDVFQDPVFLTFRVDFMPVAEEYPLYDGLYNNGLFAVPTTTDNPNKNVEYSAYDWLSQYYAAGTGANFKDPIYGYQISPAQSLITVIQQLDYLQNNPWFFQSIQGIGDLWKSGHRIKEGNKKTTLTFNCLESIEQHLTTIAENYRYAVYDMDRLSYRLPDNLRWFDMVIDLVEIRDLVDYSGEFFKKGERGLKVLQFRCKMCEFDFSDFLGGAQSDHKIFTEDKPFYPTFKVNVGWVIQQQISPLEAADLRAVGLFDGALGSLSNRFTRFLQSASRLPGQLAGSIMNELQTKAETLAMGNVYGAVNQFQQGLNNLPGLATGRRPAVGPNLGGAVGGDIYPDQGAAANIKANVANNTSDLGDAYV